MKGGWKKLGQIFDPNKHRLHPKLKTHASTPVAALIEQDTFRIFFSSRDEVNRSSVGSLDFNLLSKEVLAIRNSPVVEHGNLGSFFSDGISLGNYFEANDKKFISFMGWTILSDKEWRGEIGYFELDNNLLFKDILLDPVIKLDELIDPLSLSYPWVMQMPQGSYKIWYGSTLSKNSKSGEMLHVINHGSSVDGFNWKKNGLSLPYQEQVINAFSRPSVICYDHKNFEMWYSYRRAGQKSYGISSAVSNDGKKWLHNKEHLQMSTSNSGWDSEMIEYPFVFQHKQNLYMLYNGNDYGKTGFGLAVFNYDA
jgi:hypothetical protein